MYFGAINDWVEENRPAILDLSRALVSIPSENRYPDGDEKDVQEFVEGYLGDLGCTTDTFLPTEVPGLAEHPAYLGGRNYEGRPNVVGKKEGFVLNNSTLSEMHTLSVPGDHPPPAGGRVRGRR